MKHILLTGIVDVYSQTTDVIVDGSKILHAIDILTPRGEFDHCNVTLDALDNDELVTFRVSESAIEVLKRIDECDRMNKR